MDQEKNHNRFENRDEPDVNRRNFDEETAAELTEPYRAKNDSDRRSDVEDANRDNAGWIGYAALAISIISLFIFPVLLGIVGIIVGFIARRRGAGALGAWAIGIGVVSLLIGIFITPFF